MWSEKEYEDIHEDDRRSMPEWILKMTSEERKAEMDRLYNEMKEHPTSKEPKIIPGIKVNF